MVLQSLDAAWNKKAAEALDWIVPVQLIPVTGEETSRVLTKDELS